MRFELNDEQELFRKTARQFLDGETPLSALRDLWESPTGYDAQWWRRAAALGWVSLVVGEDDGGGCLSGLPACDAAIVAEELGRVVAPGPYLPVAVAAFAVSAYGSEAQRARLIPGLLDGSHTATWAFAEPGDVWTADQLETSIDTTGDEVVIRGRKVFVEAVATSDWMIVTGRSGTGSSQAVVPIDAPGVHVTPGRSVDLARRFGSVDFDDVRLPATAVLGEAGEAATAIERQRQLATGLQCAQINGAAGELLERTIDYARYRYAFGRPIAAYQAIKHRIADHVQRLEFARAVADAAVLAFDRRQADAAEVSAIAKAYVPDVGLDIVDDCVQINGGIGVTWEHDAHVFSRRIALDRALYGAPELYKDLLVDELGLVAPR